jgi:pimeloyl-ACP methyl ester carboxylesterase
VDAVVAAIDGCDKPVLLVGHSVGCGLAYAAVDARPDRVARAVYIGGFPTGHGRPLFGGFEGESGDLPMPHFSEFDEADLGGLDEAALADFRARAIPSPAALAVDPQQLSDERRYDVPVTAVCTEYDSASLREWIEQGEEQVQEFTRIRDLEYVDLPTGHWPQFTRPEDLAQTILRLAD